MRLFLGWLCFSVSIAWGEQFALDCIKIQGSAQAEIRKKASAGSSHVDRRVLAASVHI